MKIMKNVNQPVHHARSRQPGGWMPAAVVLLAGLVLAVCATAVRSQDADLDPFAFTRLDPDAPVTRILVKDRSAGTEQAVEARALLDGSREPYLSSATVAAMFQGTRFWDGRLGVLELKFGDETFRLTNLTRLVVAPEGETLLPVPVLLFLFAYSFTKRFTVLSHLWLGTALALEADDGGR